VEPLAVCVSSTRFSPWLDASQAWSILSPHPEHLPQPLMINGVEVSCEVRFSHRAVRAALPMTGEVSHRLSCPNLLPGPVATRQKVWCIHGFEETGSCHLEYVVLGGRDAQRAQGAVALRDGVPAEPLRPGALVFDALHAGGDMVMQAAPVGSRTDAVSPGRRALREQRPAAEHLGDRPHATEMAQSVRLLLSSVLRSSL
jgi:hypothetical protein